MTTVASLSSWDVWSGDVNLGTDGSWMEFKAIRLDEIIKEVSRDRETPPPPTPRKGEEE